MKFILLLFFPIIINSQQFGQRRNFQQCQGAPFDQRHICNRLHNWDRNARQAINRRQQIERNTIVSPPGTFQPQGMQGTIPRPFEPIPQGCMSLQCLCPYFRGRIGPNGQCTLNNGSLLPKSYRREIRQLNDNERNRYFNVLRHMKNSGEYDRIAAQHRGIQNSGHSGPAFSGWHREYLKRAEITMKLIDPSLSIPYWDSVLDNYLPNPADSIIFSSLFYGEAGIGGWVVNGPFANWHTLEGHASLQRNLGRKGHLFTENNINNALAANHVENFLAYTAPLGGCPVASFFGALEYSHASIHLFCGGDFEPISTSANDPIFFNHHAFVDLVWENWRLSHQNRFQREHDYPRDMPQCSNFQHFSTSPMRPFPILNRDGLSNAYTDNLYSYAPRPMCSPNNPNCGSQYLFCDTRGYAHCVSKVKLGGMCQGFEGFDVCFGGNCFNGRCVPRQMAGPMGPQQNFNNQFVTRNRHRNDAIEDNSMTDIDNLIPQANVSVSALICLNHDPCCSIWAAIGECDSNLPYMHRYCRRSCGDCSPTKIADAKGCVDRHVSCKFWSEHGLCSSRKQFMYENCRVSCNKCEESVEKLCRDISIETGHPKELNKPLTTTTIKPTLSIQKELVEKKKEEDLE